jgi:hypothetical protein
MNEYVHITKDIVVKSSYYEVTLTYYEVTLTYYERVLSYYERSHNSTKDFFISCTYFCS